MYVCVCAYVCTGMLGLPRGQATCYCGIRTSYVYTHMNVLDIYICVCVWLCICVYRCIGHVGKMIFSAGVKQIAIVAYVRHMHIYIHLHTVVYMCIYIYIYILCKYVYIYLYVCAINLCVCVYIYIHTYTYMCVCVCVCHI